MNKNDIYKLLNRFEISKKTKFELANYLINLNYELPDVEKLNEILEELKKNDIERLLNELTELQDKVVTATTAEVDLLFDGVSM